MSRSCVRLAGRRRDRCHAPVCVLQEGEAACLLGSALREEHASERVFRAETAYNHHPYSANLTLLQSPAHTWVSFCAVEKRRVVVVPVTVFPVDLYGEF